MEGRESVVYGDEFHSLDPVTAFAPFLGRMPGLWPTRPEGGTENGENGQETVIEIPLHLS
jgi:hypothetical protein